MTIAVDFDGTIVEHKYPKIGKEYPFAIDTLKKLAMCGNRIILWTSREGKLLDEAVEFCKKEGLEFYAVNSEYPDKGWDGKTRKIVADVYIDDRSLGGIPDWPTIYEMISQHLSYAEINPESFRWSKHRRKKKRSAIGRLIDRCRNSREKFGR